MLKLYLLIPFGQIQDYFLLLEIKQKTVQKILIIWSFYLLALRVKLLSILLINTDKMLKVTIKFTGKAYFLVKMLQEG
jgi:hypothetical protein